MAGQSIINEGKKTDYAFIVQEGECLIMSKRNPILFNQELLEKSNETKYVKTIRGYMSESTNTFQLGIITEGQWIGDFIIVDKDFIYDYNIIAKTKMKVLQISKNDILKFPEEIKNSLGKNALSKKKWIEERSNEIAKIAQQVLKLDSNSVMIEETLRDVTKKHPSAISNALSNIHKTNFLKTPEVDKGSIVKGDLSSKNLRPQTSTFSNKEVTVW